MRPLNQIEQALTITNEAYPMAVVCVVKLKAGPSVKLLQMALDELQTKYAFLRSSIKEEKGSYFFEEDLNSNQIVLKVIEQDDDDHWRKISCSELNRGFDHTKSPLMRATYLMSDTLDKKSDIVLSFHHAIIDSAFYLSLADQLLTQASGIKTENHKTTTVSPILDKVLPAPFKKPQIIFRLFPFIIRQLRGERDYKRKNIDVSDLPIPASSDNEILTVEFSEQETIDLIKWSRKNKLSLSSIISAAMMQVVNRYNYDGKKPVLRAAQFASLRPYLKPPVRNDVEGCFIAMMRFNIPINSQTDIKPLAKELDNQFRLSVSRGDKFLFNLLSKMLIKKSFRDKKERFSSTALSYAGPVQLKKKYGDIEVAGIHGFITNNSLGPELSGFGKICFGKLSLDLNILTAETSMVKGEKMVKELKSILQQSISQK